MIATEFRELIKMLTSAYNVTFDDDAMRTWYEFLKKYDYRDAREAARDYIATEKYKPSIAELTERINKITVWKKQERYEHNVNQRTVKCPHCRDSGLITWETPTGVELSRACTYCEKGRQNYPWEFKTDEEKEAWYEDQRKKGQNPGRPMEAPKDFYMAYCYGEKQAKEYQEAQAAIRKKMELNQRRQMVNLGRGFEP